MRRDDRPRRAAVAVAASGNRLHLDLPVRRHQPPNLNNLPEVHTMTMPLNRVPAAAAARPAARAVLLAHAARCAACGGTDTDRLTRLETAPTTVVAAYIRRRHRRRVWVPVL